MCDPKYGIVGANGLILFRGRASYGPSTKGSSFYLVDACWITLLLRVIVLLCQREILANKYSCVYSLLQKALILFSKLFFLVH